MGRPGSPDPPDRDIFLRALEEMDQVPDKDLEQEAPAGAEEPKRRVQRRSPDKRLTRSPDAVLDLHGRKAEEAHSALTRFVQRARHEGERLALVITGKGLRSPGGVAVLKVELERWVRQQGPHYLEAFSEAPRALGGRGAYIFYLRR